MRRCPICNCRYTDDGQPRNVHHTELSTDPTVAERWQDTSGRHSINDARCVVWRWRLFFISYTAVHLVFGSRCRCHRRDRATSLKLNKNSARIRWRRLGSPTSPGHHCAGGRNASRGNQANKQQGAQAANNKVTSFRMATLANHVICK